MSFDNRCQVTQGNFDVTVVRYPGRTQAGLLDLVVELGGPFGPFAVQLQDGIDDQQGVPYDLTDATISIVIGTAEPITLEIDDGITVDDDLTSGKFTFELTEEQADLLTAPRTPWMATVTKDAITRRWFEGVLISSPGVA